jgi:hypothetical protein
MTICVSDGEARCPILCRRIGLGGELVEVDWCVRCYAGTFPLVLACAACGAINLGHSCTGWSQQEDKEHIYATY